MDEEGKHEHLCNLGGGPSLRHDRVREWLAGKLREAYGGATDTEQPHPLASGAPGRMDIKHGSAFGHIDIDVTIATLHTVNVREALRRKTAPGRALKQGIGEKLSHYGPGVLAFAMDDTGAICNSGLRLLRKLAWAAGGAHAGPRLYNSWRAEVQHIVLGTTAGMAQRARCMPRTA